MQALLNKSRLTRSDAASDSHSLWEAEREREREEEPRRREREEEPRRRETKGGVDIMT